MVPWVQKVDVIKEVVAKIVRNELVWWHLN